MGKFWNWLTGTNEVSIVPEEETPVFEGTTADLLSATLASQNEEPPVVVEEPKENLDKQWLNLEFLKLAIQIEESASQKFVTYVDVGNLPKAKVKACIEEVKTDLKKMSGSDLTVPRREGGQGGQGGRGAEIVMLPGRIDLDCVLNTAEELRLFAKE